MEPITHVRILEDLEYFMQISFFTADLHISQAWSVAAETRGVPEHASLSLQEKGNSLQPVILSALELSSLNPAVGLDTILEQGRLPSYSDHALSMVFPIGLLDSPKSFSLDPTGVYYFVLFKVFLGRLYRSTELTEQQFRDMTIPSGFNSLVHEPETNVFKLSVRIAEQHQVTPWAVVQVEFKPLRIDISPPICDYCEAYDATVFCTADQVHLCDTCDYNHHSGNKLFMRHRRIPVSESPNLFGVCHIHPSEPANACCLTCYIPLCSQCILIGDHGDPKNKDHSIVSTTEAYRLAVASLTEPKDKASFSLKEQEHALREQWADTKYQLESTFVQADALKSRVDAVAQKLAYHVQTVRKRKTDVCEAMERQWMTVILQVEWADAFMAHLHAALPPSHALSFHRRHDALASCLFYGGAASFFPYGLRSPLWSKGTEKEDLFRPPLVDPQLPDWVLRQHHLMGDLTIRPVSHPIPRLFRVQQATTSPVSKLYFSPDDPETAEAKEVQQGIPSAEWIPFASEDLGTSGHVALAQRQDTYAVEHPERGVQLIATAIESDRPAQFRGPLVHSAASPERAALPGGNPAGSEYQSPVAGEYRPLNARYHWRPSVFEPPAVEVSDDAASDLVYHPPDLIPPKTASSKTDVTRAALQPAQGGFGFGQQGIHEHCATGVAYDDHNYTALKEMVVWNPALQRRDTLNVELWMLVKEYKFEALIMLLKTCPKHHRVTLMRILCNAANYMTDLENVIHVLVEVETHWISRLPGRMLGKYPSLVVPLLQHIFGSHEVLVRADRLFLQRLVDIPWRRVISYLRDLRTTDGTFTDVTGIQNVSSFMRVFHRIQPTLYSTLREFFMNHVIRVTARDLPPTIRSLFYCVADYGAGLQTLQYPHGILYDPVTPPWFDPIYEDHTPPVLLHRTSDDKAPVDPAVALCVEGFLRFSLAAVIHSQLSVHHLTQLEHQLGRRTAAENRRESSVDREPTRQSPAGHKDRRVDGASQNDSNVQPSVTKGEGELGHGKGYDVGAETNGKENIRSISYTAGWALSLMLREVAASVWRLPQELLYSGSHIHRFEPLSSGTYQGGVVGSNDEEMMCMELAGTLYRWMNDAILKSPRFTKQFSFDWTQMPTLGCAAFQKLADYIVGLDGAIREGTLTTSRTIGGSTWTWEGCSLDDLTVRTRNFEPLVLASMAYRERRYPITLRT